MTDHETAAAVGALTRRLRDRDPGTDDEVFALEFITALRARGWRPTEAKPQPAWKRPAGHGIEPTADYLAARQALDARLSAEEVHAGAVLPSGASFGPHPISQCRIDRCGRHQGQRLADREPADGAA